MDRKLEQTLEALRETEHGGRARDAFVASTRQRMLDLPSVLDAPRERAIDVLLQFPKDVTDLVARPVAFAALLVVMVLGGWIGSVNASLDTLPGDRLYPVKLASERAQLTLATSSTKGRLHAEFASRRLNEVTLLVSQGDVSGDDTRVQVAIDGFHKQIDGAEQSALSAKDDVAVVELARVVDQKVDELETVLNLVEDTQDEGKHEAIASVLSNTEQKKEQVVDVLIERSGASEISKSALSRQFRDDVNDIFARVELLGQRIDRVEQVIEQRGRDDVAFDAAALGHDLRSADVSGAMNLAAQGGYERAFEITNAIGQDLREVATELAAVEFALTRPRVVEPPVEEGTEETVVEDEIVGDEGVVEEGAAVEEEVAETDAEHESDPTSTVDDS